MNEITLTKLNIIGELFFNVFEDSNGNKLEEETTKEFYTQLRNPNPTNPTKDGYTWKYSYSDNKYDSQSGRLEDKTYADNGEHYIILVNGVLECGLPKTDIVDNKILQSKIDSMVAEVNAFSNQ